MMAPIYALLKPVSHPQLAAITISEKLITIGRDEAQTLFGAGETAAVSRLDARHARILLDANEFYLLDLDSAEGTTLNGNPIGNQPVRLKDGDTLCFAGVLTYTFKEGSVLGATTPYVSPVFVTLVPAQSNDGGEKIVLTHFPVLISRDSGFFALYKEKSLAASKFLSRRHACLYIKKKMLYLEDLGSTNGTWVDGVKIEPNVETKLHDGQEIAFGSDRLAYRIQLETEATAEAIAVELTEAMKAIPAGENTSGVLWIDKTMYPILADSFLDIFCEENSAESVPEKQAVTVLDAKPGGAAGKVGAFSREIKEALAEPGADSRRSRRARAGWLLGAVCLAVAAGGFYWYGKPKRELRALLEQQQYRQVLTAAAGYLAQHPDDDEVRGLASRALVKALLPQWLEHLREARFADAAARLDKARNTSQNNPEGLQILALLEWIAELQQFVAERGGLGEPLTLFKHEAVIESLLQRRDAAASEHDLLMAKIADYEPLFQPLRERIGSQLRVLRNDQSVYLPAIANLKNGLQQQMAAGDWGEAMEQLALFESRYPKVSGIEHLGDDIRTLAQLRLAFETHDLGKALELRKASFSTSLVDEYARAWMADNLPPDASLQHYRDAIEAWQAGDSTRARAILEPLTGQAWGETAQAKIEHFKQVSQTFAELQQARGSADYGERLLRFQKMLVAGEDSYFLNAIAGDVETQREQVLARGARLFEQAGEHWLEYQNKGGISGLLRLEKTLSKNFELRSEELANAYAGVSEGARLYDLLDQKLPEESARLYGQIIAETRLQRQWLTDLAMVLKPDLLDAKLQLLPDPGAQQQ